MKKWLIGLAAIIVIFLCCVYIFIPGTLKVSSVTPVKNTSQGTYRFLSSEAGWSKWWTNRDNSFSLKQPLPHGADVTIQYKGLTLDSRIIILPVKADSVGLLWQTIVPTSANPFTRIRRYNQAVELKENLSKVMGKLKAYLEETKNVYGYDIRQSSTTDTLLIATRSSARVYPSMEDIYRHIHLLQDHITANNATQTGYPMLNVTQTGQDQFQFQIAIPTNKVLPEQGAFFVRRMVPGNFMVTEVKGGIQTIGSALHALNQYAVDHQRPSMAIPFQLLITDRLKEKDSANWVTRLYYPIM